MNFAPKARLGYGQPITIPYTNNTASTITAGDVIVINGKAAIAVGAMLAGQTGSVALGHAFFDVLMASTVMSFAQFDSVYWDASAQVATSVSSGNTYLGYAAVVSAVGGDTSADGNPRVSVWVSGGTPATSTFNGFTSTIADPGASGAIPVTSSGHCNLVTAAAETRTLAAPTFVGQTIELCGKTTTITNTCTVTVQSGNIDGTNNTLTFGTVGEAIVLIAIISGSTLSWALLVNRGVVLSHV